CGFWLSALYTTAVAHAQPGVPRSVFPWEGHPGLARELRPVQFQPRFCACESPECEARPGFQYQRRGTFTRACDGRTVQRFQCKGCKRTLSTQTFSVCRGLRKPALDHAIFLKFVGKAKQRPRTS